MYTKWWSPTTVCLTHSVHTDVWLAANSLLGSTWSLQTKPPPIPLRTAKTTTKVTSGPRKVSFTPETIEVITSKAGIFITKAGVASGDSRIFQDVTKAMPRDKYTFFTVRTQQLKSEDSDLTLQAIDQYYEMLTPLICMLCLPFQGMEASEEQASHKEDTTSYCQGSYRNVYEEPVSTGRPVSLAPHIRWT